MAPLRRSCGPLLARRRVHVVRTVCFRSTSPLQRPTLTLCLSSFQCAPIRLPQASAASSISLRAPTAHRNKPARQGDGNSAPGTSGRREPLHLPADRRGGVDGAARSRAGGQRVF